MAATPQPSFVDHSYDPQSVDFTGVPIHLHTRLALLEKELEHCQTGKARAEIAVQYLANLNATGVFNGSNGHEQISELTRQLAQIKKEKEACEAKLENALAIITTILRSKTITSTLSSTSTNDNAKSASAPKALVPTGDLIDLAGTSTSFNSGSLTENDTTLLDDPYQGTSSDEDEVRKPTLVRHNLVSTNFDGEAEPYKYHFLDKVHDAAIRNHETSNIAYHVPKADTHAPTPPKSVRSSPIPQSETSIEPDTDASSHGYAASSDGPVSTSSSFVTANSQVHEAQSLPCETVVEKAVTPQDLGVRRWNVAATATSFEDVQATGPTLPFREEAWSRKNINKVSVTKVPYNPFLKGPAWQACKLFSSRRQREDTIAFHKAEKGPSERIFVPDLLKYGVRFEPDPSERNIYRTVLIGGLSSDTTMHQLLQNVRGGTVVDAKLLETSKFTDSNSALIVFLHEHAAMAYEEYVRTNSITINNRLVNVMVVNSPSYPTRIGLQKAIEDHQHTRCLEIHRYPRCILEDQLRLDLRVCPQMKGDRVEHLKMREDKVLELHFSSIDHAGQGFGLFTTHSRYEGCMAWFVPDPCAQPLETLLQKNLREPEVHPAHPAPGCSAAEEFERLAKIESTVEPELACDVGSQ